MFFGKDSSKEGNMSLTGLSSEVAEILKYRKEKVATVESTTGGLISAALLSAAGASRFYTSGCVVYSPRGYKQFLPKDLLDESGVMKPSENYANKENYINSKTLFVETVAKNAKKLVKTDWFICESGTVGPKFYIKGLDEAFTAVSVAGPEGFLRTRLFFSSASDREENMWSFTNQAMAFFTECVRDHEHSSKQKANL